MKKLSLFLLSLTAPFYFAQQAGDIVNFEQKMDLTPQGVINFISNNTGNESPASFLSYLKGFNLGLKAYKITYYTKNENNILVKATGLVMYPNVNYKLSTVVSDHPTTDSRNNVPSNLKGIFTLGFALELSYALNGYIVMAPDYVGMGTGDGIHPYVHFATESGATIDFVTAANKVLAQLNINRYDEYFLTGYSQGAHAAMSTLKKLSISNPNQLKFKYAYLGAGPYDLSDTTLQKGILDVQTYPRTSFIANIVNTCNNSNYKMYTNNISEIISADYIDKYNYHVIEDNGGLSWGPKIWRNLFTQSFISDATNNINHKLRQCLKSNNVYDWYNTTPTTLGHSSKDLTVHPDNTSKTIDVQRGYYSLWNLNKYKLQKFYWGPLDHGPGAIPYVLASNAKFNTLRSGGFFNGKAILASIVGLKQVEKNQANPPLYSSQIKPDLKNMELIEITDFNKEKAVSKSASNNNLASLKDGVYLLKVSENNENKLIPYIKNTPKEVTENEIVQSEINNVLKLKINPDELSTVNIFDESKTLIKTISKEQYDETGGINLKDLDNQNYTFEVVTPYYNLQFNKALGGTRISDNTVDIFTQNKQIMARSKNNIKNVSIYTISGTLIQNQDYNKSDFESKNLEPGVYVIQIVLDNGKTVNKKIKL